MNNITFLNSLAKSMSAEYQERIPTATAENISEIAELINQYPTTRNEFISALTNKVAKSKVIQKVYNNRFKFLKKGSIPYGTSIELIVADIVKGKNFGENFGSANTEIGSLLAIEKPEVKVQYIERNIQLKYKLSISNLQLMGAFNSENGLSNLVNALITSVVNSMEFDEELLINKAINTINSVQAKITDWGTLDEEQQAKKLTKLVMVTLDKMQFLSTDYNTQNYHTFCKPDDVVIFVTPETKAMLNVDLLANTYNMEKADINARIVLVKEFEDAKTIAKIIDKECIQFFDNYQTTATFENADNLTHHTFYHRGQTLGICQFFNSLDIVSGE